MTLLDRLLAAEAADETSERILDAAYARFVAAGLRRTTVDDVARHAGLSRITVYRRFARKSDLVDAVILRELRAFLRDFERAVSPLPTMADRVAEGFAFTLRAVRGHPLLGRLLREEPETILPHLTLGAGPFLAVARDFLSAHLPPEVAELFARLTLSFLLTPDSVVPLETDEQAREFARRHLVSLLP
ncbi:TetR/AcrR family transcriptional regulator [Thermoactinospora rubra]|uniref:TetR/AcrR family transcriptional regulator n=1 Tax=Thermoactinospora rubra TaxID=1088767 RepID=UPI000A0F8425|nr:TetR/AcrR family transcriptional regulator [Thermoactinospora rubra]